MKSLTWDYTSLAHTYGGRPPYAETVIDELVAIAGVTPGDRVCDIGAGTGHLSVHLVGRGLAVDAVEPNDAMRAIGRERLAGRARRRGSRRRPRRPGALTAPTRW